MIYCATRFDGLFLCELPVGHKGAHALRARCVYCDDVLGDGEISYHINGVCDRKAHEEGRCSCARSITEEAQEEEAHDMLAQEVDASVRRTVHRIERVDSASTATRGDDDDDAFVLALLDSADEVTGVWRGSDRATAQLEAVELLMLEPGWPTVRVTVNYGGSVTVRGTWGSAEVERETWAGMLAEHLFEMLGGDDRREVQL